MLKLAYIKGIFFYVKHKDEWVMSSLWPIKERKLSAFVSSAIFNT